MGELIHTLDFAPQARRLRMPLHTSAGVLWELPGVHVVCATRCAAAVGEAPLLDAALVPDIMRALAGARAWLCGMDASAARRLLDARVHPAPAAWALDTALSELERAEADALTDGTTPDGGNDAATGGANPRRGHDVSPDGTNPPGGELPHRRSGPPDCDRPHSLTRRVRTAALAFAHRPAELEAEVAQLVAVGEHTIKIKIGMGTVADDLALAHAARSAAGPDVALRLDANGAWDEDEARRRIRALAAVRPEFIEQPTAASDPAALARVRRGSPVPIAADEAARDVEGARRVLAEGAADVLVLKPAALGSFRRARELAAQAEAHAVDVVLSSLFDGPRSLLAALRLAAELKLPRVQGLGTGGMLAAAPHRSARTGAPARIGAGAHAGAGEHATFGGVATAGDAPAGGAGHSGAGEHATFGGVATPGDEPTGGAGHSGAGEHATFGGDAAPGDESAGAGHATFGGDAAPGDESAGAGHATFGGDAAPGDAPTGAAGYSGAGAHETFGGDTAPRDEPTGGAGHATFGGVATAGDEPAPGDAPTGAGEHATFGGDAAPGDAPPGDEPAPGDAPTGAGEHATFGGDAASGDEPTGAGHAGAGEHATFGGDAAPGDAPAGAAGYSDAAGHADSGERLRLPAAPEIPLAVAGVVEFCA